MKKHFTKLAILPMVLFINSLAFGAKTSPDILLRAWLKGEFVIPKVITNANGIAGFMLNATHDTLFYNISVAKLSGAITAVEIMEGDTAINGSKIKDLTSAVIGNRIRGFLTGSDLTVTIRENFLNGDYYLIVKTAQYPDGEIRGQIRTDKELSFLTKLSGADEVPAVTTNGSGLGSFHMNDLQNKMELNVAFTGFTGNITGAHFHKGTSGVSGPVVIDLSSMISGNTISGTIDPTVIIKDLFVGNIYLNVHTDSFPDGEIRGQLEFNNNIIFDGWMMGDQEVPVVSTNGIGLVELTLSNRLDTIWYDAIFHGLTGNVTSAHFHRADAGVSGPVVHDVSSNINGNSISGTITGTSLTNLMNDFLSGAIYLNVHTGNFPDGEIRGQVYKLLSDGFMFDICKEQETQNVTSVANGSAVASINRSESEMHFSIAFDNLTGTPTGAHFHSGEMGVNGPVIFDLTSMIANNSINGYWTSNSATPFTSSVAQMIRDGEIYVNIHTALNPDGEIRGQVIKESACAIISDVELTNLSIDFEMYPVPASDKLVVKFDSSNSGNMDLKIYNILGDEIYYSMIKDSETTLNVQKFKSGIYYVKIENEKYSIIKKLIVE